MKVLDRVGDLVVARDFEAAREAIDSMDQNPLRKLWAEKDALKKSLGFKGFQKGAVAVKPKPPSAKACRELFRRDRWHCRYYGIDVVDVESRKRLSMLLDPCGDPPLFKRKDHERHAALLNLSASPEHVVGAAAMITRDEENLVTACWLCQFGKVGASLDFLGLEDPRTRSPICTKWDGLTRVLKVSLPRT